MKKVLGLALVLLAGIAQAGDYTRTRYPLVLAPGVLGFDKVLGIEYWYGIPGALRSDGAQVYVTSASAFNSTEARGEQTLKQVQDILAITGAAKINMIGHSHGGFSVRYVANLMPNRVASLTLVGSPVKGTPVADLVSQFTANPTVGGLVGTIGNAFSSLLTSLAGNSYSEDVLGSMASLTTRGAAAFNATHSAGVPATACGEGAYSANGMRFYSWGGTSATTNIFDATDVLFGTTSLAFLGKESNDGLVGRCSNHFGKVLRDNYPWNHGDEINHLFGLRGLFTTDPVSVYRQQANRLKLAGL